MNKINIPVEPDSKVLQWIESALKSENVTVRKVLVTGTGGKGDGFLGDILYTSVQVLDPSSQKKEYNLVIKKSRDAKLLDDEKFEIIKRAFENETYFYTKILPQFKKFEEDKNLKPFDLIPKCFGGFTTENHDAIILQNLKTQGYDLFGLGKTLPREFRNLTLNAYGHFHAVSFVFKHERPEEFKKICGNLVCNTSFYLAIKDFGDMMEGIADLISEILIQNNEEKLLDKFEKKTKKGVIRELIETLENGRNDEKAVFCHADCWLNNYLFQFQEQDGKTPLKVAILDFQLSVQNSVVFDLAYHLYAVLDTNDYKNIKQDLEIYYNSLSKKIRELGGDPAKIFPFCDLVKHWKKYSFSGFMIALLNMMVTVADKDDMLNMEEIKGDSKNLIINRLKPEVRERFFQRVLNATRHNLSGEL